MKKVSLIVSMVAFATAASAWEKPDYPRIGGYKIGGGYEKPEYQALLAKMDVSILAMYAGWELSTGVKPATVVQNMKARNPNTLIFNYASVIESRTVSNFSFAEQYNKLTTQKWWLYQSGTGGSLVATWPGQSATNLTNWVSRDANGDRYNTWYAKFAYRNIYSPAPALDGIYTDVFRWKPKASGDYDRDGTTDSADDPAVGRAFREGNRAYLNQLKAQMPGKLQIGNIGSWAEPNANLDEYKGQMNGGVLEYYIGKDWSIEGMDVNGNVNGYGSWAMMMERYHKMMTLVAEPKLILLGHYGDPKNYKAMRYGLTSTLMDDGYYDFAPNTDKHGYASAAWFDEFDAKLGKAISAPQLTAWQNGVYRRDFENGIALVNPRGNGSRTVDLGEDFRRLSGKQDPNVNNGQVTRKVTLSDRDGIILMRMNAVSRPKPPSGLSVQ